MALLLITQIRTIIRAQAIIEQIAIHKAKEVQVIIIQVLIKDHPIYIIQLSNQIQIPINGVLLPRRKMLMKVVVLIWAQVKLIIVNFQIRINKIIFKIAMGILWILTNKVWIYQLFPSRMRLKTNILSNNKKIITMNSFSNYLLRKYKCLSKNKRSNKKRSSQLKNKNQKNKKWYNNFNF